MATAPELEKGVSNFLTMLSNVCYRASKDIELAECRVIKVAFTGKMNIESGEIRDLEVTTTKPIAPTVSKVIDDPTTVTDDGKTDSTRLVTNGGEDITGSTTTFTNDD